MSDLYEIHMRAWADALQQHLDRANGITREMRKQWDAEMQWLRESMQRDMLPDWLIEMVCEQWNRKASE